MGRGVQLTRYYRELASQLSLDTGTGPPAIDEVMARMRDHAQLELQVPLPAGRPDGLTACCCCCRPDGLPLPP